MSIRELVEEHMRLASSIMKEPAATTVEEVNPRADRLVVGLRHVICCAVLVEANEAQLLDMAKRYGGKGEIRQL